MTVFSKDPRSPEMLAELKQKGLIVVEATVRQLFILHQAEERSLKETMQDWFVRYNGRSHAYRDGSHVGGADEVQHVCDLTNKCEIVLSMVQVARTRGDMAGYDAFSRGQGKPANPYQGELAAEWEAGYSAGWDRCDRDK